MIESVQEAPLTLSSNSANVSFAIDDNRTRSASCCGWLQHSQGSPLYSILEGGKYLVTFNSNITSATTGTTAIGLYQDGVLVPGSTSIFTVTTAGDYGNVSFHKTIEVCCRANANLTVASVPSVLTGTTPTATDTQVPTLQNANFSITRIC